MLRNILELMRNNANKQAPDGTRGYLRLFSLILTHIYSVARAKSHIRESTVLLVTGILLSQEII